MIDSVLKGNGNSRFLKSAVPAGTSWADALAMLQAGTFPIDFNGINAEGFQQVGTPLNKANLLKDATAAQIGLPTSTTPDGMFQALGNTGELHVWRKTLKDSAGYTLGSAAQLANLFGGNTGGSKFRSSSSLSVSDDGTLSLLNEDSRFLAVSWEQLVSFLNSGFKSKYIICEGYPNSVYYIPQDAEYSLTGNYLNVSKAQLVSGYPAAYTTTYPVSTNPNAYQEGSDAKPAGYVLGNVVTGNFSLTVKGDGSTTITWLYSSAVTVSDNGEISFVDSTSSTINAYGYASNAQKFKGKFCKTSFDGTDFAPNEVCFIPANASIVQSGDKLVVDRYQPVTGYAAIPAGTTIEYLGKLGDKARVQVVSYVGTGTYGGDNQCSITANFKIKSAIMMYHYIPSSGSIFMISDELSTDYTSAIGFSKDNANYSWGKKSADGKTLFWYCTRSANGQFNESGKTYYVLCIG